MRKYCKFLLSAQKSNYTYPNIAWITEIFAPKSRYRSMYAKLNYNATDLQQQCMILQRPIYPAQQFQRFNLQYSFRVKCIISSVCFFKTYSSLPLFSSPVSCDEITRRLTCNHRETTREIWKRQGRALFSETTCRPAAVLVLLFFASSVRSVDEAR